MHPNRILDFSNQVVAITGAARGIGLATARSFALAGAHVALMDRDGPAVTEAAHALQAELQATNFTLQVPRTAPLTVRIEAMEYDATRGTFSATLVAPATGADAQRTTARGRVNEIVQVPVLANAVAIGAVIRDQDVAWLDLRSDRLTQGLVLQYDQLVGTSPRRAIRPNEPEIGRAHV